MSQRSLVEFLVVKGRVRGFRWWWWWWMVDCFLFYSFFFLSFFLLLFFSLLSFYIVHLSLLIHYWLYLVCCCFPNWIICLIFVFVRFGLSFKWVSCKWVILWPSFDIFLSTSSCLQSFQLCYYFCFFVSFTNCVVVGKVVVLVWVLLVLSSRWLPFHNFDDSPNNKKYRANTLTLVSFSNKIR